jgi:hypothetical protein
MFMARPDKCAKYRDAVHSAIVKQIINSFMGFLGRGNIILDWDVYEQRSVDAYIEHNARGRTRNIA